MNKHKRYTINGEFEDNIDKWEDYEETYTGKFNPPINPHKLKCIILKKQNNHYEEIYRGC